MANKTLLSLLSSLVLLTSAFSLAEGVDQDHYDLSWKSDKKIIEMINEHLDSESMNADYRLQRDAAVILAGCNVIPGFVHMKTSINHGWAGAKNDCFRNAIKSLLFTEVKFGQIIHEVCSYVQNTFPGSPNVPIATYSDCIQSIVMALGRTKMVTQKDGQKKPMLTQLAARYELCESSRAPDYWEKPTCYSKQIPYIEDALEALPKSSETQLSIRPLVPAQGAESTQGSTFSASNPLEVIVKSTPLLPPRDPFHRAKVSTLYGACASLNTDDLEPNERKSIEEKTKVRTYSIYREEHCFRDGLFALATGATIPGIILAGCRDIWPGQEFGWIRNIGRDFKTICYVSGVLHAPEIYSEIKSERDAQWFTDLRNFVGGLFDKGFYDIHLQNADQAAQADQALRASTNFGNASAGASNNNGPQLLTPAQEAAVEKLVNDHLQKNPPPTNP